MKVLAIGAHPDDIEIFMYGILSCFKKNGNEIFLTVATDGSQGGKNVNNNLSGIRALETKKALKNLGILKLLNLRDGNLGYLSNDLIKIKKNIDEIEPDLIITHYEKDYHSDHINLSKLVKQVASHYIPIIYCDTMMGINFNPCYYIDITEFYKEKIIAIRKHESQSPERFVNLIKLMNSFRAAQCNAPLGTYAEAYYYEKSFPFSDIRNLLPPSLKIRPFHISQKNGFL